MRHVLHPQQGDARRGRRAGGHGRFRPGAGKIAEALLIGANGSDAESLHLLGVVRAQQGKFEEAVSLLLVARHRAAPAPGAMQSGQGPGPAGTDGRSGGGAQAAIKLKPDHPEALFELGVALRGAGRLKQAESAYRKLLRLKPGDADAKLALGNVLLAANRLEEAEIAFQRGLDEKTEPGFERGCMPGWRGCAPPGPRRRGDGRAGPGGETGSRADGGGDRTGRTAA